MAATMPRAAGVEGSVVEGSVVEAESALAAARRAAAEADAVATGKAAQLADARQQADAAQAAYEGGTGTLDAAAQAAAVVTVHERAQVAPQAALARARSAEAAAAAALAQHQHDAEVVALLVAADRHADEARAAFLDVCAAMAAGVARYRAARDAAHAAQGALYDAVGAVRFKDPHEASRVMTRFRTLAGGAPRALCDPFTPAKRTTDLPHVGVEGRVPAGQAAPWRRHFGARPFLDAAAERAVPPSVWDAALDLVGG